jgi:hypothetical protein
MTFKDDTKAKFCVVCKGLTPSWTSEASLQTTLRTDWGEFTVHYHKVCFDDRIVKEELTKLALEAKPKDEENKDES